MPTLWESNATTMPAIANPRVHANKSNQQAEVDEYLHQKSCTCMRGVSFHQVRIAVTIAILFVFKLSSANFTLTLEMAGYRFFNLTSYQGLR